ncbi:MAG: SPFH domain-containing protein [Kofleriaceae bacterium]
MVLTLIIVGGVILLGILVLVARCWKQIDQGRAMIVNKMGSEPRVTFTGAIVLPIVNKAEVMDLSVKTIEISRRGKEGLICQDNIRADIKVTFFVRINNKVEDVLRVAQSIGCIRASQQQTLEELFSAKFSEALKTAGKKMEFEQLYTKRDTFKDEILAVIGKDLNGYVLDDAAIDYLEQTPVEVLDPQNVLDSLGIEKITKITTGANIATNQLRQTEKMELGKQNLTSQEALYRFEQQQAEAEAKKNKEIAVAQAQQENEASRFRLDEEKRTHVERQKAEEAIQMAEQAKLRSVQVSEQGRIREVEVEKVRVAKAHDLEEVGRRREVELGSIEMNKAVETEKRSIADIIRARIAVDKTVAVEEEAIKDLRTDSEAKRHKHVTVVHAEAAAQELFIKDIKKAEAEQQVATSHAKKQLILAEASMESSDKEARAAIRRSEGAQAEHAAQGLANVRVKEADALATEKVGLAESRVRDAQVQITEKEGTVIAENIRRKAMAEAQGREAEAAAIEKTGIAHAVGVREKLLAEVAAKDAEAGVIEKRMLAEAKGIESKAEAMKHLDGAAREHEEFRLRLDNERQIALEQIKARVAMTEHQSKVMAEAMGNADIKIVGGDGQFFDRFVRAMSLGTSIDSVVESSDIVRKALGDRLNGNGNGNGSGHSRSLLDDVKDMARAAGATTGNQTVSNVLGNLLVKADDSTKSKIKALLEQARSMGVHDDKVS